MRFVLKFPTKLNLAVLCAALLMGGCATGATMAPPSFATADKNGLDRTYRLGIGDKLKITVFEEQDLSGQFEINALGQVSLPLIGEVSAKGLSIANFRNKVRQRLANGYLNNPRVTVEVLNYRSFFVHGEVKNGGEFTFKVGTRLRDAVATAGGYTYRAQQDYVLVTREGQKQYRINLPSDIPVLPGDNIRIPERFF